jgi:hypothetical protein
MSTPIYVQNEGMKKNYFSITRFARSSSHTDGVGYQITLLNDHVELTENEMHNVFIALAHYLSNEQELQELVDSVNCFNTLH